MESVIQLQMQPYQTNQLHVCFRSGKGDVESVLFCTGLCVYSMDKNHFYLLGETSGKKIILRMDRILSFKPTEETNYIYRSQEYQQIYDEMFSIQFTSEFVFSESIGLKKKLNY